MTSTRTLYDTQNITRAQRAGGILAGVKLTDGGRVTAVGREYYPGGFDVMLTLEDGTTRRVNARDEVELDERFEAGDGASVQLWTDAHAYTVIKVSPSGKTITLQRARPLLTPGGSPRSSRAGSQATRPTTTSSAGPTSPTRTGT
jgi:hypothetical protein